MPGITSPVKINGRRCVDGGVVEPVPDGAFPKFSEVDRIVAVSVIPSFEEVDAGLCTVNPPEPPPSVLNRLFSSFNRSISPLAPGNVVDTFRQSIRAAQIILRADPRTLRRAGRRMV